MEKNQIVWWMAWSLIFSANLIIPLMFGWDLCSPAGKVGLVVAVLAYWGLGFVGLIGENRWGRALVCGGIPVGLSQFWPVAQMWAGVTALRVWSLFSGDREGPFSLFPRATLSGAGGFVVTFITGALLMSAAFALGWILIALFNKRSIGKPKPEFRDEL